MSGFLSSVTFTDIATQMAGFMSIPMVQLVFTVVMGIAIVVTIIGLMVATFVGGG